MKSRVGTEKGYSQKCAVFDDVRRKAVSRRRQAEKLTKEKQEDQGVWGDIL